MTITAHPHSGFLSTLFLVELEFRYVVRETGVSGEKPLGARERTSNNEANPHMASSPGFEPRR